jgi:hypothetical protein
MPSKRAVLILKGDMPAEKTLHLLEKLMTQTAKSIGPEMSTLQPWGIFSLICGSGNAGYACSSLLSSQAYFQ